MNGTGEGRRIVHTRGVYGATAVGRSGSAVAGTQHRKRRASRGTCTTTTRGTHKTRQAAKRWAWVKVAVLYRTGTEPSPPPKRGRFFGSSTIGPRVAVQFRTGFAPPRPTASGDYEFAPIESSCVLTIGASRPPTHGCCPRLNAFDLVAGCCSLGTS